MAVGASGGGSLATAAAIVPAELREEAFRRARARAKVWHLL